jgi:hypothetical protein
VAIPKRLKFALAQRGTKRGAPAALTHLLNIDDLQDPGWRQIRERTWRAGLMDKKEWSVRARSMGSISCQRSFAQSEPGGHRLLTCQASPLASADDAGSALEDLPNNFVRFRHSGVNPRILSERWTEVPLATGVERQLARITEAELSSGLLEARLLAGSVRSSLCLVMGAGIPGSWTWEELGWLLALLASKQ